MAAAAIDIHIKSINNGYFTHEPKPCSSYAMISNSFIDDLKQEIGRGVGEQAIHRLNIGGI